VIRYVRARVPVYLSALLMLCAVSLAVDAAPDTVQHPTWPEISLAIWIRYGAAVATSIAATWVLMAGYERRQDARHAETMKALATAANRLQMHDADPAAHFAAGEHNHRPMNEQADRLETKVDQIGLDLHDLIRDHKRIQETEGSVCDALAELRRRDPKDSPHPRRKDDSRDDYTALRGKG
jgi:flagellar biosynthesis/type III secretory pathway M-ring protein FliF/YscJ